MAGHTSEKRWDTTKIGPGVIYEGISGKGSKISGDLVVMLHTVEEAYQEMQEIYTYAGGTNADLAELLFKEDIAARSSPENVASQEEIDKATDLVNAMTAAHQLYQAANNVAVTQADRFSSLRRMS